MSVAPLDSINPKPAARREDSDALTARLDRIGAQLDLLTQRQAAVDELIAEVVPLGRLALGGAVEKLDALERAGYFAFTREFISVVDRIVRSYTIDDVRRLGDQVVGIVDTVRNLTQPDVLGLMNDVAGAVHDADDADPKGLWGMMRAGKDPEVRKGLGVLMAIVKQVGRAADRIGTSSVEPPPVRLAAYAGKDGAEPPGWVRHLAPRRARPASPPVAAAARSALAPGGACATVAPRPALQGAPQMPPGYGPDGFLVDPTRWTRELALQLAALVPLALGDEHWRIIEWARAEYAETGTSPNIRRLALGTGASIRDVYALFPGKPGVLVAMLAGIPKPGGCL